MELESKKASPPDVGVPLGSPVKWSCVRIAVPAGEPADAYAALRWKSGLAGFTPSAMYATVTPAPSYPAAAALSALMTLIASGSSSGFTAVPQTDGGSAFEWTALE